jgi:4-amino-4-deoxy-L-arabinose transferase-like glycosyltransferase
MLGQTRRTLQLLGLIILLAVLLRGGAAFYLGSELSGGQQARIKDQVSYNALAHSIIEGRGYSFDQFWYPFTPANTPTAHWSFLYPLYLALVYLVFGPNVLAARLIQAIISGILSTWLFYLLGRKLFGQRAGLLSAFLGAVYAYFVFHDAALMTESFFAIGVLASFTVSLSIVEAQKAGAHRHQLIYHWLLLGVILGATAVLRQTILLWAPFLFGWLLWKTRRRTSLVGAAAAVLVVALFVLPWTIRNYMVYGAFLPLNSNAGYALYSALHPDHGVQFVQDYPAPIPQEIKRLNEARLNSILTRQGIEFVLQDPTRYFFLTLSKIPIFFNFWFSSASNFTSNLFRVLSFGLYLPFFLYGLLLSIRDWRKGSLIYLFVFIYSAIHILTWASIRYRLVIDAALMPFAALAVMDLLDRLSAKSGITTVQRLISRKQYQD